MSAFTEGEIAGLRRARAANQGMSQRELARFVNGVRYSFDIDGFRSVSSIYGAIRRIEKVKKAVNQGRDKAMRIDKRTSTFA